MNAFPCKPRRNILAEQLRGTAEDAAGEGCERTALSSLIQQRIEAGSRVSGLNQLGAIFGASLPKDVPDQRYGGCLGNFIPHLWDKRFRCAVYITLELTFGTTAMQPAISLSDALAQYRGITDATHRFWGYFQAVAAGTAAFAWSREGRDFQLFLFLSAAFLVFAFLNWRLVVESQAKAEVAAKCVKEYAKHHEPETPPQFLDIAKTVSPERSVMVAWWHGGLSVATFLAVWWRYWSLAA